MKRRLVSGGIAVSVVAAFAVAVLVGMVLGAGGITVGGITVGGTGGASARDAPSVLAESPSPSPSPVVEEEPVALFVGDSYTVGQGATSPELRWSTLVSEALGWRELNVAVRGTGFVKGNAKRDNYPAQLRSVPPGSVDIVVIAGGQNDFRTLRSKPGAVFDAVEDTYALAVRQFPGAEIVSVGPSTPRAVGLEVRALDSAVRAAAVETEATYVSLLDPNIVQGGLVHEDGVHTTDAGNAAIARQVVRALQGPAAEQQEDGARPADILTSR
ncbi:SGNH/GDSL hydrolase family protein [Promicromonospora sp. NPDC023987]|uniref:SGNH/GDSL hydrolase family protein n=1 Tax=Promicromonospora sp. NPDC023987 TaxID=3155360 RepID=UPI0033E6AE6C